jgi:hypothetical protein
MAQVTIDPRFFRNAVLDYSNPKWAFAREFMQNAMDSGAANIDVCVELQGEGVWVSVKDDGCGMDEEILVTKLLALGASGKEFRGTVGGFGKAKEILYFGQGRYRIRTSDMILEGRGGNYEVTKTDEVIRGTEAGSLWIYGGGDDDIRQEFVRCVELSTFKGRVTVDGRTIRKRLTATSPIRDLTCGKVSRSMAGRNLIVIRVRGVPMYDEWISPNCCVIVELNDPQILTANRDGVRYPAYSEISSLIADLNNNRRSSVRPSVMKLKRYEGGLITVRNGAREDGSEIGPGEEIWTRTQQETGQVGRNESAEGNITRLPSSTQISSDEKRGFSLPYTFILKNNTDMEVPGYFTPETFGYYSRKLLDMWVKDLILVHKALGHQDSFGVGFILDDEREAEHQMEAGTRTYFLNPAVIVQQKQSQSRSFRKRFKLTHNHRLLALAIHEVTHGMGFGGHDEDFASGMTNNVAKWLGRVK